LAQQQTLVSGIALMAGTNEDVLEAIVHEHARLVYRIAYLVLRNHHDAEDATQETFLRKSPGGSRSSGVRNSRLSQ
jgi:RNA polymerase sigma-70 factor (ECF subfamily)